MRPSTGLLAALLLLGLARTFAVPSHYWMHATPAVREAHNALRTWEAGGKGGGSGLRRLSGTGARTGSKGGGVDCGKPPAEGSPPDPMWFTQAGCSLSSMDGYAYMDSEGNFQNATKGEKIQATCDDVFCPVPPVPDCYEDPGICKSNEWCWIDQHEKWGSWAMGAGGATPTPDTCGAEAYAAANDAKVPKDQKAALKATLERACTANITWGDGLEVWKPIRGQCVAYRQLQQSCLDGPLSYTNSAFDSRFLRTNSGKVFGRPLVCDPRGGPGGTPLVCTGADFDVMPSTCVQARPRDQCFSGPWWYSKDCPRTADGAPKAGLSPEQARSVASTALLLFAGEVAFPATCQFWDKSTAMGRATEAARRRAYAIVAALWPVEEVAGPPPSYNTLMKPWNISSLTDCEAKSTDPDSPQAQTLAALGFNAMQPNKIWSLAHFLAHNQPSPMSSDRVEASRALATFLLDYFWCDDCRGFFYEGIVSRYGLPPDSPDPTAHARWWWWAHNVAAEHLATTRGGHPWIHQSGAADVEKYQNPYFMTWQDAVAQWQVVPVGSAR